MEKIDEIEDKIQKGKDYFQPLWGRYDSDFNLWQIKDHNNDPDFDHHEGAINRTSNRPRAFADKCQGYLSRSKMNIRVKPPSPLASSESVNLASKIERMLRFGFYEADKRLIRLQKPDLKNALIWFDNNRGRIGVRVLVQEKDGRIIWNYLPLDPRHLIFDVGEDGVLWFACRTWRSRQSVKDNFGVDVDVKDKAPLEVWDYWNQEINTVICHQAPYDKGSNTLKEPTPHNLPRPPISLVTVPTNPSIFDDAGVSIKFDGESIYAPNRLQYKQVDQQASLLASHVEALVKQPLIHLYDPNIRGDDGKPVTIDKALYYAGAMANLPNTHKFMDLPRRDIPRAFEVDYANMQRNEQLATFADVEYGVDQPPHSGTALSLLREDKNKVLLPRLQALQFSYSDICQIACEQLRKQGITVTSKILSGKEYNIEEVTPAELEAAKDYYMDVDFKLSYPYEDIQILGLIEMATKLGVIDIDTAREELAQVQDPEAIKMKVAIQKATEQFPEINWWDAEKGLRLLGADFAANLINQQIQVIATQRKQATQQAQGGIPEGQPPGQGGK